MCPDRRLLAWGSWKLASHVTGFRSIIGSLWLFLSWKQGQKLGKLAVISQILVISVIEVVVWFPGLLLGLTSYQYDSEQAGFLGCLL